MIESPMARVALFVIILVGAGALLGFVVHSHFAGIGEATTTADSQTLIQIQEQLNAIDKRLGALERRKTELSKAQPEAKGSETPAPSQGSTPHASHVQFQVSPPFTHRSQTVVAQAPPAADPASAQKLATLEQGIGALQEEASSNREAWQATTNRLAEVAGELGTQDGKIIKSQDELNRFLGRAEHNSLSFELRRSSGPEAVGPVRISLKTSNQKSQRYTLCVYLKDSCVQMRDRVIYEVVQLAVSHDTGPLELIATKVDKDGIVGYLEVPREYPGH
jgi:hypothetical protein